MLLENPDALAQALRAGEVDVAMTNLASYLAARTEPNVQAVAVLDVPEATAGLYRGVLVARRDAGLASMADLPAKAARLRYAEVLPGSTSGAAELAKGWSETEGAVRFKGYDAATYIQFSVPAH